MPGVGPQAPFCLGIDLGTSGLRLALIDAAGLPVEGGERALPYPQPFEQPGGWRSGLVALVQALPAAWRQQVVALSVDGTSGTLLACRTDGEPLGEALSYALACPEQAAGLAELVETGSPAGSSSSSLARALRLLQAHALQKPPLLLRHQADWVMGWLLGTWRWVEEGNNLKLGWQLEPGQWAGSIGEQHWSGALPEIVASGAALGPLQAQVAAELGLPPGCLVIAGTTDANAAVLAAAPRDHEGVAVLGSTLVLKQFVSHPIEAAGVSCHRVAGRWLVGGASNAGGVVLRRFFTDQQLRQLSRQIDTSRPSGLDLLPLPAPGERFPVDDPALEPVLEPRPVSDVRYLQALLEGLSRIEAQGWQKLQELGAPALQQVVTLGGGARNPKWRQLRQQLLGIPVRCRPGVSCAFGSARLAQRGWRQGLAGRG